MSNKTAEIKTKGFFIQLTGEPSVGIYDLHWSIGGDEMIFEDHEDLKCFKQKIQEAFEFVTGDRVGIATIEEEEKYNPRPTPKFKVEPTIKELPLHDDVYNKPYANLNPLEQFIYKQEIAGEAHGKLWREQLLKALEFVSSPKPVELPSERWDDISKEFDAFKKKTGLADFYTWISRNFNPPTRLRDEIKKKQG